MLGSLTMLLGPKIWPGADNGIDTSQNQKICWRMAIARTWFAVEGGEGAQQPGIMAEAWRGRTFISWNIQGWF